MEKRIKAQIVALSGRQQTSNTFTLPLSQQTFFMPATRVLIIGCGIAGPILAIFLKRKGYDPIVFERLGGVQDAGLGLM